MWFHQQEKKTLPILRSYGITVMPLGFGWKCNFFGLILKLYIKQVVELHHYNQFQIKVQYKNIRCRWGGGYSINWLKWLSEMAKNYTVLNIACNTTSKQSIKNSHLHLKIQIGTNIILEIPIFHFNHGGLEYLDIAWGSPFSFAVFYCCNKLLMISPVIHGQLSFF